MKTSLTLVLVFSLLSTFAQTRDTTNRRPAPFTEFDLFISDITNLLRPFRSISNETVIADFSSVWDTHLTDEQRNLAFEVGRLLYKKGFGLKAQEDFYACLAYGYVKKGASPTQMTRFLQLADSCTQLYSFEVVGSFLQSVRQFFEESVLYKVGPVNSSNPPAVFRVVGGEFNFNHSLDEAMAKGRTVAPKPEAEYWHKPEDIPADTSDDVSDDTGGFEDDFSKSPSEWADAVKVSASAAPKTQPRGPYLEIRGATLELASRYCASASCSDTFVITQTSGRFEFAYQNWLGEGGIVTWSRFGLDAKAELRSYTLKMNRFRLEAPDALLSYPQKLTTAVEGLLEYESTGGNRFPSTSRFPRFTSNESNITINEIAKDVKYIGGFSLEGKQIRGNSLEGGENMIEVSKNNKLKFRAFSRLPFVFEDSIVSNRLARLVVYHGRSDSIEHLGLHLKYNTANGQLYTRRPRSVYDRTPFTLSYFGTEVNAENLIWNVNTDSIDLNMALARDKTVVEIESKDYYDPIRFTRLTALRKFHPLQVAVGYAREKRVSSFRAKDAAKSRGIDEKQFRAAMHELHLLGYVHYNATNDYVTLKPKANLYFNAVNHVKGSDYDNMRINSLENRKANTTIFLDSNTYKANGVYFFLISDSMKVKVTPIDRTVYIKKNRDTEFSGKVETRRLVFRGKDFKFRYDSFLIRMPKIDSMSFVTTDSATGISKEMDNKILMDKGGVLLISRPRNKSGLQNLPEYPRFTATGGGKIDFDGKEILNGVYDPSRVYFDIPFIDIDSTNTYDPNNLGIRGTFYSSGMFPDFVDQPISIMPDGSFGFRRSTPAEGYPIYNGKGTFFGEIKLDNGGVRGKGHIDYLNGVFYSDDFVYYSDSLKTYGIRGEIKAGIYAKTGASFPHVVMNQYKMDWDVLRDSMVLETYGGDRFKVYDDELENVQYEGFLIYEPKNLRGGGRIETVGAQIKSNDFDFRENDFDAKKSEFMKIKSEDPKKEAVLGQNVNVLYDLKNRYAEIEATDLKLETETFSFPYTEFKTSLSLARWEIDRKKVFMSKSKDDTTSTATFISTSRRQAGLEFAGKSAEYDLKDFKLSVSGVPGINVAEDLIIPDSGQVIIRRGAEIDRLKNSQVIFNAKRTLHQFDNCDIKITSRNNFTGTGKHLYVNESGDKYTLNCSFKVQKVIIKEDKRRGSSTREFLQASATAKISEDSAVKIFPGIIFRGDLTFKDNKQSPEFRGEYTLDIEQENPNWLPYVSTDSIRKAITVDGSNNREATGVFVEAYGEKDMYASFLELDPARVRDIEIFVGKGELKSENGIYIVSPPGKMNSSDSAGNRFIYDPKTKKSNYDGRFTLIQTKEGETQVVSTGKGDADHKKRKFNMNLMIGLRMDLPNSAAEMMAQKLAENKTEDANPNPDSWHAKLVDFLTDEKREDYLNQKQVGTPNYLDFLDKFITLSDVDLRWSSDFRALYSMGKIGVYNIGKYEVNAKVEGFVEVPKEQNHNTMYIYLKNGSDWFFIEIERGTTRVYSNNTDFKTEITKKKEAKIKWGDGDKAIQIISNFRSDYLGIQNDDVQLPTEQDLPVEKKPKNASKKPTADESEEMPGEVIPSSKPKKEKKKKKDKEEEPAEEEQTPEEEMPKEEEKPKKEKKKKKKDKEEDEEIPSDEDAPKEE